MIDARTPDILTKELHDAAVAWKTLDIKECVFETLLQPAAMRCLKNGWTEEQIADLINAA